MNSLAKPFARILLFTWTALLVFTLFAGIPARAQTDAPLVLVLTADGPLTQTMSEYLNRGIEAAEEQGAELLVLQLDTPGGHNAYARRTRRRYGARDRHRRSQPGRRGG